MKNILVIKVDAIGDYIIFRNFLEEIAKDAHENNQKVTLLGNELWKDLFLELDKNVVDDYLFLKNRKTWTDIYVILRIISRCRYLKVINFHYSRNFFTDTLTFATYSPQKIAMNGEKGRKNRSIKPITDKIYTFLVNIPVNLTSEFEYDNYFAEILLNRELKIQRPVIQLDIYKQQDVVNRFNGEEYLVFAPGAGAVQRQLEKDVIVKITGFLCKNHIICFVGSKADIPLVNYVKERLSMEGNINIENKIIDLTGKIQLNDTLYVIDNALFVLCNDSGIFHMAVALNKQVFCFAGGGHYDRFVNYIKNDSKIKIINHYMPCYNCSWNCSYKLQKNETYPCIKKIAMDNINELLSSFFK